MRLTIFAFLLAVSGAALAFDDDCGDPDSGTTYVQACLLSKQIREMNIELNVLYRRLLEPYQSEQARKSSQLRKEAKLLVESQRAWISYRDKVCDFENEAFGGINSISWTRCEVRITETRLKELKAFVGD
jgi:uncharacterized protein YecT (DUF1311 family)